MRAFRNLRDKVGDALDKHPISEQVEHATSDMLLSADTELNEKIVRTINKYGPEAAKPAVKTLRRRISHKNDKIAELAFVLLNTLAEKCSFDLRVELAKQSFLEELEYVITNPATKRRIAALAAESLQRWAVTFGNESMEYEGIAMLYHDLKRRGTDFPESPSGGGVRRGQGEFVDSGGPGPVGGSQPVRRTLSPEEKLAKLERDLSTVKETTVIVREAVASTDPLKMNDFASEMRATLQEMVRRCERLLDKSGFTEEMVTLLLETIEQANDALGDYDQRLKQEASQGGDGSSLKEAESPQSRQSSAATKQGATELEQLLGLSTETAPQQPNLMDAGPGESSTLFGESEPKPRPAATGTSSDRGAEREEEDDDELFSTLRQGKSETAATQAKPSSQTTVANNRNGEMERSSQENSKSSEHDEEEEEALFSKLREDKEEDSHSNRKKSAERQPSDDDLMNEFDKLLSM